MTIQDETVLLNAARALVTALESGDEIQSQAQLDLIKQTQQNSLFLEVGKLTRELHDALANFNIDARLADLTHTEIPDTRERLNFVIETTEEAAHKTLELIDETLPLTQELKETADNIDESWHRFRMKEMTADEFRVLTKDIGAYLPIVKSHTAKIHENLSDMTLAQGFQDITGQVIRQVITLVEEVENNLVQLVKIAGTEPTKQAKNDVKVNPIKAEGPQINPKDKTKVVNNQDEVDDLLSSLGF
jgi:chemotaxis protein CheZ